jgi:hypothetical protein
MNTQEIINLNTTKTHKIELLLLSGLTRKEVANLVANGNYGFVQNVYARLKAQGKIGKFSPEQFNRKFGVEIEAYNIEQRVLVKQLALAGLHKWKVVRDSSIIGENSFELVSPILQGIEGLEQVRKVCNLLKNLKARINKSCGLHIHFDARNLELQHFKQILLNYASLEETINGFLPKSRRKNSYCNSLKSLVNFEEKVKNANTLQELASIQLDKYYKVNAISYIKHGTIEFRQHSGTIEFDTISHWVLLLHNLISYSAQHLIVEDKFEVLNQFNQPEIVTYYRNKISEFA